MKNVKWMRKCVIFHVNFHDCIHIVHVVRNIACEKDDENMQLCRLYGEEITGYSPYSGSYVFTLPARRLAEISCQSVKSWHRNPCVLSLNTQILCSTYYEGGCLCLCMFHHVMNAIIRRVVDEMAKRKIFIFGEGKVEYGSLWSLFYMAFLSLR